MAEPVPIPRLRTRVARAASAPWARLLGSLVVLGLLVWFLRNHLPFFRDSVHRAATLHSYWIAASIAASFLSFVSASVVQKRLLGTAGVRVGIGPNLAVVLASTSWAVTVPGGQVFSTALTYRETRRWGAAPVVASWQLVMSGLLASTSLAFLGLLGFFLVGAATNPVVLGLSILALTAAIWLTTWATRHPDSVERLLGAVLQWWNRRRRKPAEHGMGAIRSLVHQLASVELGRRDALIAFLASMLNWLFDVVALGFAVLAIGSEISVGGLIIAFVTGKLMSTVQVTPGGIGQVEAALIFGLTLGGLPAEQSFASVVIFRLLGFVLFTAVGWLVFLWLFQGRRPEPITFEDDATLLPDGPAPASDLETPPEQLTDRPEETPP